MGKAASILKLNIWLTLIYFKIFFPLGIKFPGINHLYLRSPITITTGNGQYLQRLVNFQHPPIVIHFAIRSINAIKNGGNFYKFGANFKLLSSEDILGI